MSPSFVLSDGPELPEPDLRYDIAMIPKSKTLEGISFIIFFKSTSADYVHPKACTFRQMDGFKMYLFHMQRQVWSIQHRWTAGCSLAAQTERE